jgi:hypothetical protein
MHFVCENSLKRNLIGSLVFTATHICAKSNGGDENIKQ